MDANYNGIVETLSVYFDGLYYSDTTRLSKVFHPKAHYVCATEDPVLYLEMNEYFSIVDKRPSPASRGEMRRDIIEAIELAGPVTATARVKCSIRQKYFTDFLTLIFVGGAWRIISKVFHYDLLNPAMVPSGT